MFQFGLTWQLRPKNRDSPCFWSPGLWQLHFLKQKPKPLSCRYFHPRHCLYNLFVPWHWHFVISRHGSMTKLNGIKRLLYVVRSKTLFTAHPFNLYVVDYHHLLICFLVCSSVLFFCFCHVASLKKPRYRWVKPDGFQPAISRSSTPKTNKCRVVLDRFGRVWITPAFQYWFLEGHPGWWLITLVIIEFPRMIGWPNGIQVWEASHHLGFKFPYRRNFWIPRIFVGDAITPNRLFTTPP